MVAVQFGKPQQEHNVQQSRGMCYRGGLGHMASLYLFRLPIVITSDEINTIISDYSKSGLLIIKESPFLMKRTSCSDPTVFEDSSRAS